LNLPQTISHGLPVDFIASPSPSLFGYNGRMMMRIFFLLVGEEEILACFLKCGHGAWERKKIVI
jgi:hypothetical protein